MSDFTGEGFRPFPNTHSDAQEVSRVAEWSDEALDYKTQEYGAFLQRDDIMERARTMGNLVLDRLMFELGYRDGIYTADMSRVEDEVCQSA